MLRLALIGPVLLCALALSAATGRAQSLLLPVESIVAQVEDEVVLRSELDEAIAGVQRQYAGREAQLPPADVLERQVLERLITMKLQLSRAENTGIEVTDTDIDNAVGRLATQNKMTVVQMRDMMAADGVNFAEFRDQMRDELMAQKLRQRVVESRSNVSESEVDILLASDSLSMGEVRLAHILITVPPDADADAQARGKEKLDGIKKLIDEGSMEFQAAAIRYSDAPQALEGGDLGWRRYDQIPESFTQAITGLNVGDVTNPIRALSGFHLLKILDKRDDSQIMITEYSARHILVDVSELVSEMEAKEKIESVRKQIVDGTPFEEIARKNSDDSATAPLGGDLGWFQIETYGPNYAERLTAMKDGALSEVFQSDRGWHLLQRLSTRSLDRTQEYVRGQARENLRRSKGEEAYEQFLRQLRSESYIKIIGAPEPEADGIEG